MSISGISNRATGLTPDAPDAPAGNDNELANPDGTINFEKAIAKIMQDTLIMNLMDQDPNNPMRTPSVAFEDDFENTY